MRPLALLLAFSLPALHAYDAPKIDDEKDRQVLAGFLQHTAKVTETLTPEYAKTQAAKDSESYCWIVLKHQKMPLTAYHLTGDAKYLDQFVACFANLQTALTQDAKGFKGWYGKPLPIFQNPDQPDLALDVIITSFSAVKVLSEFIETIDAEPALKEKFAKERAAYLDLMENHLVKKWEARGSYVDLGATGAIYRGNPELRATKALLTQPHNKHEIITAGLLALHRVTGNAEYLKKAIKLGVRFKHCLSIKDGAYAWNYWDPAGAWDIDTADAAKWKHWIGVEHKGGYYSASLTLAVLLHHHGLVFDAEDMKRFVKTQTEKAWNGDFENPKWARCDGTTSEKYMQGAYMCGSLAPFDDRIAKFCFEGARQEERVKNANHGWQGGIVASGYLEGKYVGRPKALGGKQVHKEVGERFRANSEHAAWLKDLEFNVEGAGYVPPKTPPEFKNLPAEPAAK
ncbi:MAG: hypothetical protein HS116_14245 [Planctomycetes bacterium]|nr:hypothetical protein [Planctomycetota bacterium]